MEIPLNIQQGLVQAALNKYFGRPLRTAKESDKTNVRISGFHLDNGDFTHTQIGRTISKC